MSSVKLSNYDKHIVVSFVDNTAHIDHVPAMVYTMTVVDGKLIMIKDRPQYETPAKKYGDHAKYHKRITASYDPEGLSTGVILDGMKGAGKSMLAEDLGNWMIKRDFPVIVIDHQVPANILLALLQLVGPCMVYFDEFGKMYTEETERDRMLTLFSDTSLRGTLFVVTSNDLDELSEFMVNRPGRFLYRITYGDMAGSTGREIAKEMGLEDWQADVVNDFAQQNTGISFDQVLTLCRQIVGTKDVAEVREICSILNLPALKFPAYGIVKLLLDNTPMQRGQFHELRWENDELHIELINDTNGELLYSSSVCIVDGVVRGDRIFFTSADKRLVFEADIHYLNEPYRFGVNAHYRAPAPEEADRGSDRRSSSEGSASAWGTPVTGSLESLTHSDFDGDSMAPWREGANVQTVSRMSRDPDIGRGKTGGFGFYHGYAVVDQGPSFAEVVYPTIQHGSSAIEDVKKKPGDTMH